MRAPSADVPWRAPVSGQWTLDARGVRSDPVNLYVHGAYDQVRAVLIEGGWMEARPVSPENNRAYLLSVPGSAALRAADAVGDVLEHAVEAVTGKRPDLDVDDDAVFRVQSMPISPQTLEGRPALTGFQKNNEPLGGRDHLRIFDTGQRDTSGLPVWAISASRDTSIILDTSRPEQGFLNHAVESNTDLERDFVFASFRDSVLVSETRRVRVDFGREPAPATGALPRDGAVYDILLK